MSGKPSYTGPQPTANVVATVGFAGTLSGYLSQAVCPFRVGAHNQFVYLVLQGKGQR